MSRRPPPSAPPSRGEVAQTLIQLSGLSPAEVGQAAVLLLLEATCPEADFMEGLINLITRALAFRGETGSCDCEACKVPQSAAPSTAASSEEVVYFVPFQQGDES